MTGIDDDELSLRILIKNLQTQSYNIQLTQELKPTNNGRKLWNV